MRVRPYPLQICENTVIGHNVFGGPLRPDHVVPALRDLYRRGVVDTALIAFGSHVELRTFLRAASRAHR